MEPERASGETIQQRARRAAVTLTNTMRNRWRKIESGIGILWLAEIVVGDGGSVIMRWPLTAAGGLTASLGELLFYLGARELTLNKLAGRSQWNGRALRRLAGGSCLLVTGCSALSLGPIIRVEFQEQAQMEALSYKIKETTKREFTFQSEWYRRRATYRVMPMEVDAAGSICARYENLTSRMGTQSCWSKEFERSVRSSALQAAAP